jgi:hypothetical protein
MSTTDTDYHLRASDLPRTTISPMCATAVTPIVQQETDCNHAPWVSARKILPGLQELRWVESNPPILQQYAGQWVAVKGNQVVKHGESFDQVHDAVSADAIGQALITFVRGAAPDIYDIA